MLHDPRHDRPARATPSFEGFAAFVVMRLQHKPDATYNYGFAEICPVGQYLHFIHAYWPDWHREAAISKDDVLWELDELAYGDRGGRRDKDGRFVGRHHPDNPWSYRALWRRIQHEARQRDQQRRGWIEYYGRYARRAEQSVAA